MFMNRLSARIKACRRIRPPPRNRYPHGSTWKQTVAGRKWALSEHFRLLRRHLDNAQDRPI